VRVFLDANVLFTAAHNPNGKAALIIGLAQTGSWSLVTSAYAYEETTRNLERKAPDSLVRMGTILDALDIVEHHPDVPFPSGLAAKDRPIFQAALGCGASHLLTGDLKHFGPVMNRPDATFGVIVQTVAQFLQTIVRIP